MSKKVQAIDELNAKLYRATNIYSENKELDRKQELHIFQEEQKTKDRVDISLREYESLKEELKQVKKGLERYEVLFHNINQKLNLGTSERVVKKFIDNLANNEFRVVINENPNEFKTNVAIITSIDKLEKF